MDRDTVRLIRDLLAYVAIIAGIAFVSVTLVHALIRLFAR